MSDVFTIFMPGAKHWDEVRRAEKILLVDARQGGTGPDQFDLDAGFMVLQDRTGQATQTHTELGNQNRDERVIEAAPERKSAADDITAVTPPTAVDPTN